MYISQPIMPALTLVSQLLVIDPQQVQDRRVQIVHVYAVFRDVVSELIRLAVNMPRLHAGTREQRRETIRMVIASQKC